MSEEKTETAARTGRKMRALLATGGKSLSDLRAAGYSLSALRAAGWSLSALDDLPTLERPYTRLLAEINAKKRAFRQSTWGPVNEPPTEDNLCNTPMCTAGHLVSMAGPAGWKLKEEIGWAGAAACIHAKAHPDHPCQNFGSIPDEWALAYIEEMAALEASAQVET